MEYVQYSDLDRYLTLVTGFWFRKHQNAGRTSAQHVWFCDATQLSTGFWENEKILRVEENWSGCGSEFSTALYSGMIGKDHRIELYVHPDMRNGIPTDMLFTYKGEEKPLTEIYEQAKQWDERI